MNREYALELIESRVDQYMNIPSELHRGFAMGLARFALESNLITPDEYITYCDRMNEASYNVKNTFEEIAQALSPIVEHSKTINLWRYDLGARPDPALLDEISDSLEDALWILKSAIAAEKKMPNVNPRTNLTLKPELHDLIQETADHLGLKRAQLITNLLEEFAPQLEKMCIAFREIKEKQVDPSLVVSAFGADSMAEITQATAQLAQELAQMQKGKTHD